MRRVMLVIVAFCVLVGTSMPVSASQTAGSGPATATWDHHTLGRVPAGSGGVPEPVRLFFSHELTESASGAVVTNVVTFDGVASAGSCQSTGPADSSVVTVTGTFRHLGMTWRCTGLTVDKGWTTAWEACYWTPTITARTTPDFNLLKVEATFTWTAGECTSQTTE